MTPVKCFKCGRDIVFALSPVTGEKFPLEKVLTFEIKFLPAGWTAQPVEPVDSEALYIAHSKVCPKKETP